MGRGEISRIMQGELAKFLFCPFQTNLEAAFFLTNCIGFVHPLPLVFEQDASCVQEKAEHQQERERKTIPGTLNIQLHSFGSILKVQLLFCGFSC